MASQSIDREAQPHRCIVDPPIEVATRSSSISEIHESPRLPVEHLIEAVTEPSTTNSAGESAELHQSPKEYESPMERINAKPAGTPAFPLYDRFGWLAITVLVTATTLILSALGFLWFLWMADHSNRAWHRIAAKSWITRTVALSSLVLRTSMSMQASTATSMLAGLALEHTQVLLLHLASVSTMRNANAGPYMLAWLVLKAFLKDPCRWHRILLPILIFILVITSTLAQFTSTTLLADLKPGTVPGYSSSDTTATNFHTINGSTPFTLRGTVWNKKPPFYPAFAEYHEFPTDVKEDRSDTGLTLRAFLPLSDQETRSSLRTFSGLASVLDSRVQCLRPQLTQEKGHYTTGALALTGLISAAGSQSTNFSCVLPNLIPATDNNIPDEWRIAITYLSTFSNASFAPVQSEFRPFGSPGQYGMQFVVVNMTAGSVEEWARALGVDGGEFGTFGGTGAAPILYSNRQEWLDLLFTKNASLIMSVSLCYASYDTADLAIHVSSDSNRTEPVPRYDPLKRKYDYSSIRSQLGQLPSGQQMQSPDDRGVLSISKRKSWQPGAGDDANSSWLLDAVALTLVGDPVDTYYLQTASSTASNITAYLYEANSDYLASVWAGEPRISTDPSMTALTQEILKDQRGIASAIQSLLTVFTSMSYYDQLQQFNNAQEITTTSFIIVSKPASVRGIIAVTIVASVHLLLIAYIIYQFLSSSSVSTIGNAWQTIAQVVQGDAKELIDCARLATDGGVEGMVKERRWKRRLVGLKVSADETEVELTYRDSPTGLAKLMKNERLGRLKLKRRRIGIRTNKKAVPEPG